MLFLFLCLTYFIQDNNQQGPTAQHMNSAQCYMAAWMGGKLGEWIHVYVWLSHSAAHLKLSQHCQLALLQYKIKSFLKKE